MASNKYHKVEVILGTINNSKFKWAIAQLCYCTEMGYNTEEDFILCVEEAQKSELHEKKWRDILSILKEEGGIK